jgi:Predicted permease
MRVLDAIGHALATAGSMTWQVTWSLILGFTLSAVVQAVVRRGTVARLLGDDRPKTLALATGLGAASSSCSYAAVALARALIRRGASFTAALASPASTKTGTNITPGRSLTRTPTATSTSRRREQARHDGPRPTTGALTANGPATASGDR